VEITGDKATAVIAKDGNGVETRHECDAVITTMPLPWLAERLSSGVTPELLEAASHLKFKAITINGLLVKKEKCIEGLYIYYRDRMFHRVGEPKNAGLRVTPEGHTVLIVETTCEEGDDRWTVTDAVREEIMKGLEAENVCKREEIVEWHVLNHAHGYPAFRLGFEEHYDKVMNHLKGIANLTTVGRQGAFTYPNMHKAMRMGADAAENLLKKVTA
jgi:protoporphyrinogen oxidase